MAEQFSTRNFCVLAKSETYFRAGRNEKRANCDTAAFHAYYTLIFLGSVEFNMPLFFPTAPAFILGTSSHPGSKQNIEHFLCILFNRF